VREADIDTTLDVALRQLLGLGRQVVAQFPPLDVHLGLHRLVLAADRDVLPGPHRERPADQARDASQYHGASLCGRGGHPGDQGEVGHEAVDHAEYGRTQPAAGHVAMVMLYRIVAGQVRRGAAGHVTGSSRERSSRFTPLLAR